MVVIETLVDHRVRRGKKKGDKAAADKSEDVVEYLVQYSKAEGQSKGDKVIYFQLLICTILLHRFYHYIGGATIKYIATAMCGLFDTLPSSSPLPHPSTPPQTNFPSTSCV